jgi:hypothetical protein
LFDLLESKLIKLLLSFVFAFKNDFDIVIVGIVVVKKLSMKILFECFWMKLMAYSSIYEHFQELIFHISEFSLLIIEVKLFF